MKKIVLALSMLFLASPAHALDPSGTGWVNRRPQFNMVGLQINAGIPDGAGIDLVFRPVKFARAFIGVPTNLVSAGIRGGITLALPYWIAPSLTLEGGHMFDGNFNKLIAMFSDDPKVSLLDHIDYSWGSLMGGLEIGHWNWFQFYIHIGYTYLTTSTNGLQSYLQEKSGHTSLTISEANGNVLFPNIKLGFIIYL